MLFLSDMCKAGTSGYCIRKVRVSQVDLIRIFVKCKFSRKAYSPQPLGDILALSISSLRSPLPLFPLLHRHPLPPPPCHPISHTPPSHRPRSRALPPQRPLPSVMPPWCPMLAPPARQVSRGVPNSHAPPLCPPPPRALLRR